MLIEFEIENDCAFAGATSFSMAASTLKERSVAAIRSVNDAADTKVLTSALVLGKNGSGKSTFINAMAFTANFVKKSALDSYVDRKLPFAPNRLEGEWEAEPTRYRILFSVGVTIYEFEYSYDRERIIHERLDVADRSTRFRRMYVRDWVSSESRYEYGFGEALTGSRSIWARNTRENALYLSTAAQLNSEDLRESYDWLSSFIQYTAIDGALDEETAIYCLESEENLKKVVRFLESMDVNLADIIIDKESIDQSILHKTFAPDFIQGLLERLPRADHFQNRYRVSFTKRCKTGADVTWSLNRESTGTKALFALAGPMFRAIERGHCLIIDEINTSLHPLVVHNLVALFSDEKINARRAQLIFTSHDVSVLREGVLRRDQIWVIESNGYSSELIPISDYSPRKDEAIEKGYLAGRYGGIPVISPEVLREVHGANV